jgi:uncharacterized membrane protein YcaP (DUF421 family)
MLFNSWAAVIHSAVIAACGYVAVVIMVRVSGNKTLSRMTAFDFIVAVSMGSLLGRAILSTQDSLSQFVVGFAVLAALQVVVSRVAARSQAFHDAVTPPPKTVYHDGKYDMAQMHREGVSESEIAAAVRMMGLRDVSEAERIVLETNGELSVVWRGRLLIQ